MNHIRVQSLSLKYTTVNAVLFLEEKIIARKEEEGEYSMSRVDLDRALFVGVDIHSQTHMAVAATRFEEEKGRLQFHNSREGIETFLTWLDNLKKKTDSLVIGIEGSGGNGQQLTSSLVNNYHHVYEVNPLYTKERRTFGTQRDKSDIRDAKLITEVLSRKLSKLPRLIKQQYTDTILALIKAVRWYEDLVYQRARLKNRLHSLLIHEGIHHLQFGKKQLASWKKHYKGKTTKLKDRITKMTIRQTVIQLERIQTLCFQVEQEIKTILEQTPYKNLKTIKGINTVLTAQIVANIESMDRFTKVDRFIKYAGIAPVEKGSGKKTWHIQCKEGNRKLNGALYMVALNQLRWNTKAKIYFEKKIAEGKTKKHALRCLMKRTACIVYGMLKNGRDYQDE